jgi:hypothetical protein
MIIFSLLISRFWRIEGGIFGEIIFILFYSHSILRVFVLLFPYLGIVISVLPSLVVDMRLFFIVGVWLPFILSLFSLEFIGRVFIRLLIHPFDLVGGLFLAGVVGGGFIFRFTSMMLMVLIRGVDGLVFFGRGLLVSFVKFNWLYLDELVGFMEG